MPNTPPTSFFHTAPAPRPLPIMQLAWVGEDRLAVSNPMGLGLYDMAGQLLAFKPNDFGIRLSWRPSADFVRYINGVVRDWYWEKQAVKPVEDIHFHVFDGTFDHQGNYLCCGEASGGLEDVGEAAVFNKHGEKLEQYGLMYRAKQLALSPDQSKAAFCTNHGIVDIRSYPRQQGELEQSFRASDTVMGVAWTASGRYLAVALVPGWLEIRDVTSEQRAGVYENILHKGWSRFMRMEFVPGSEHLLVASHSSSNATHLFDWHQGRILKTNHRAIGFAISPSGTSIALGYYDGRVVISSVEEYLDA